MFREEFYRAFRNRSFFIALIVGALALAYGFYDYGDHQLAWSAESFASLPPFFYNAYDAFIWSHVKLVLLIAPLIATLPFAASLAGDCSSGYLRLVLSRVSYRRYLWAKFTANLVAGSLAVILPLILLFVVANVAYPRGLNLDPYARKLPSDVTAYGPFGWLYTAAPDLYVFSLIALDAVFGAIYATLGLALVASSGNRYVALAAPFLMYQLANFVAQVAGYPAWSPLSTFAPPWLENIQWIHIGGGLGIVFVFSVALLIFAAPKVKSKV